MPLGDGYWGTSAMSPTFGTGWSGGYSPGSYVTSPYQIQTPSLTPNFGSPNITPGLSQLPSLSGQTEAVTVNAAGSPQQVTTPSFSPGFGSPTQINTSMPALTEAVTVNATPSPQQVQSPSFSGWTFNNPVFSPAALSPTLSPAASPGVEAVTVEATRSPTPYQVTTPTFSPRFGNPDINPADFPLPFLPQSGAMPPPQQQPTKKPKLPSGSSGGMPPPKVPQPPKQQQPAVTRAQQQQPAVTPAQQAALNKLTPAQLAALLNNLALTPAQRAAVQQTLAAKQGAARQVAAGGGSAAQQAAAAKAAGLPAPASPLQPSALVVPLIIAAGVATAWGLTHRQQVTTSYRSAVRRVRRVIQ